MRFTLNTRTSGGSDEKRGGDLKEAASAPDDPAVCVLRGFFSGV